MEKDINAYKVIELLIVHEEKIAELYNIYSENFMDHGSFWKKIASEERTHAKLLRELQSRIENGEALFNRDKFSQQAVRVSMAHVDELIKEGKGHARPLLGALQAALDIEQGLIEMEYYKVLDGDTEEVAATFNRLAGDEKRHRMQIQEKLVALTGKPL